MNAIVRRAGRRDLDGIHALWRTLREAESKLDSRLSRRPDSDAGAREHLEVILADPRTALFVAEERGLVVGFLHAQLDVNDPTRTPDRFGTVVDLVVRDDRRSAGLGERLLDTATEWVRSNGVDELRCTVPARNLEAREFFERQGASTLELRYVIPLS